jgi:hypothetical protein
MGIDPATMSLIAGGFQLFQGIQGMQQAKVQAKQNNAITAANIQNEQNRLSIEQDRTKRQLEQARGSNRVAAAASGATLGSFDDIMGQNAEQSLMDLALLEYDSKVNQESMKYEGAVRTQEYKSKSSSSLLKGIGGAAGSFYDAYDYSNKNKK